MRWWVLTLVVLLPITPTLGTKIVPQNPTIIEEIERITILEDVYLEEIRIDKGPIFFNHSSGEEYSYQNSQFVEMNGIITILIDKSLISISIDTNKTTIDYFNETISILHYGNLKFRQIIEIGKYTLLALQFKSSLSSDVVVFDLNSKEFIYNGTGNVSFIRSYSYFGSDFIGEENVVDIYLMGSDLNVVRIYLDSGFSDIILTHVFDNSFILSFVDIIGEYEIIIGSKIIDTNYDPYVILAKDGYLTKRIVNENQLDVIGDQFVDNAFPSSTNYSIPRDGQVIYVTGSQLLQRTDRGFIETGLLLELVIRGNQIELLSNNILTQSDFTSSILYVNNLALDTLEVIERNTEIGKTWYDKIIYRYVDSWNKELASENEVLFKSRRIQFQTLSIIWVVIILEIILVTYSLSKPSVRNIVKEKFGKWLMVSRK